MDIRTAHKPIQGTILTREQAPKALIQAFKNPSPDLNSAQSLIQSQNGLGVRSIRPIPQNDEALCVDLAALQLLAHEDRLALFGRMGFNALYDCSSALYLEIQSLEKDIEAQAKTLRQCSALTQHLIQAYEAAQKAMQAFQEGLKHIQTVETSLQNCRPVSLHTGGYSHQTALEKASQLNLSTSLQSCQKLKKRYADIQKWDQSMGPLKQDAEALKEAQHTYEQARLRLENLKGLASLMVSAFKAKLDIQSEQDAHKLNTLLEQFSEASFKGLKEMRIGETLPAIFKAKSERPAIAFPELERLTFKYTYGLQNLKLPLVDTSKVQVLDVHSPSLRSLEGLEDFTQLWALRLKTESPLKRFKLDQRLETLGELTLSGDFTSISGIEGCPNLQYVALKACAELEDCALESLKTLQQLHTLHIRSLPWIPCLEGLDALEVLEINSISGDLLTHKTIQDLKLSSLKTLRTLNLANLHPLKSLTHMGVISSLEALSLSKIYILETLQGLDHLPNLHSLHLEELPKLKPGHLQVLERLPKLSVLTLKNCPGLVDIGPFQSLIEKGVTVRLESKG